MKEAWMGTVSLPFLISGSVLQKYQQGPKNGVDHYIKNDSNVCSYQVNTYWIIYSHEAISKWEQLNRFQQHIKPTNSNIYLHKIPYSNSLDLWKSQRQTQQKQHHLGFLTVDWTGRKNFDFSLTIIWQRIRSHTLESLLMKSHIPLFGCIFDIYAGYYGNNIWLYRLLFPMIIHPR